MLKFLSVVITHMLQMWWILITIICIYHVWTGQKPQFRFFLLLLSFSFSDIEVSLKSCQGIDNIQVMNENSNSYKVDSKIYTTLKPQQTLANHEALIITVQDMISALKWSNGGLISLTDRVKRTWQIVKSIKWSMFIHTV